MQEYAGLRSPAYTASPFSTCLHIYVYFLHIYVCMEIIKILIKKYQIFEICQINQNSFIFKHLGRKQSSPFSSGFRTLFNRTKNIYIIKKLIKIL